MGWHPGQVALLPTQNRPDPSGRAQLGDAQPTAVGDQDPGGIAVPVPVLPCGGDQALDFFKGQAFAGAALAPRDTGRGRTVPFSVIGITFCAVSRVIAHTVSHTPNCPIKGPKWDSLATPYSAGCLSPDRIRWPSCAVLSPGQPVARVLVRASGERAAEQVGEGPGFRDREGPRDLDVHAGLSVSLRPQRQAQDNAACLVPVDIQQPGTGYERRAPASGWPTCGQRVDPSQYA